MAEAIRLKFYQTFTVNYDKFASEGKVFLVGDSNARLGEFLSDLDIHGKAVTNKNLVRDRHLDPWEGYLLFDFRKNVKFILKK